MNPSAYSSGFTAIAADHYTPTGISYDASQLPLLYPDYSYGGPSCPVDGYAEPYRGADEELYEGFLTSESARLSISPYFVVPAQSAVPPPYHTKPSSPRHAETLTTQFYTLSIAGSQPPSYATSSSLPATVPSAFRQALPQTTLCLSSSPIYPPSHYNDLLEYGYSSAPISEPSPYPSPPREPSSNPSSELIASKRRNGPAHSTTTVPADRWHCPYCTYVQENRRMPDLKRHIQTHTLGAEVAVWVCCGVPAMDALGLGVPAEVVRESPIFEFDGMGMIGGCRKTFSRKDALLRHLRMGKGKCYGDANSMHQPGNRLVLEEA